MSGAITSLFSFGNAVGLTVQAALIDRFGDRVVVFTAGMVSGRSLGTIALLGGRVDHRLLALGVLVAGVTIPAITTAVRRSLPGLGQ